MSDPDDRTNRVELRGMSLRVNAALLGQCETRCFRASEVLDLFHLEVRELGQVEAHTVAPDQLLLVFASCATGRRFE